jgi:hypothetical protein
MRSVVVRNRSVTEVLQVLDQLVSAGALAPLAAPGGSDTPNKTESLLPLGLV